MCKDNKVARKNNVLFKNPKTTAIKITKAIRFLDEKETVKE
jgi:hypothetical protein